MQWLDLPRLFRVVAVIEMFYGITGLLVPPAFMEAATGWVLLPDGQWLTKLLGLSLLFQAWVAWTLRDRPHIGIARGLACYQIGAATVDWVL